MSTYAKLNNLLAILGNSRDQIAETLVREGCFGDSKSWNCPVSHYLAQNGFMHPACSSNTVSFTFPGNMRSNYVNLPAQVSAFIRSFDSGDYLILRR